MKTSIYTKREYIKSLRNDYEDFKNLNSKIPFAKDYDRISRLVSTKIYSRSIQFILELIQNAEDNKYAEDKEPQIIFTLQPDKLLVQNNEIGFNNNNVFAICRIGEDATTKREKTGYIGEKGIGFKSVFLVSKKPEIHSNGYHFRFNKDEKLGMVNPIWVDNFKEKNISSEMTNFILPFPNKDIFFKVKEHFQKLGSEILLFLRKINKISIKGEVNKTITKRKENGKIKIGNRRWKIVKRTFNLPPDISKSDQRKSATKTEITFAFELNRLGNVKDEEKPVFAYFPMRSYGLKFIAQADFQTIANREDLEKDSRWNKWLIKQFPYMMLYAIHIFKKDDKLKFQFYNYIPFKDDLRDLIGEENPFMDFIDTLHRCLKNFKYILTENEEWVKPNQVKFIDQEIREYLPDKNNIHDYYDLDYKLLHPELNHIGIRKLKKLELEVFSFKDFCNLINNEKWLGKQGPKWFISLYKVIANTFEDELESYSGKLKIKGLKIFPCRDGNLYSADEDIYYGIKYLGYGFEDRFTILSEDLGEAYRQNEKIKDFFDTIDVTEAKKRDINNYIDQLYSNNKWRELNKAFLFNTILFLKDKGKSSTVNNIRLRTKSGRFINPDEKEGMVFLPSEYTDDSKMEILLDNTDITHFWVSDAYLKINMQNQTKSKEIEELKDEWKDFFNEFDISNNLKIKSHYNDRDAYTTSFRKSLINNYTEDHKNLCSLTTDEIEKIPSNKKFKHHIFRDKEVILLEELVHYIERNNDIEKAKILIFKINKLFSNKICFRTWKGKYGNLEEGSIKIGPCSWIHLLKNSKIFPTTQGLKIPANTYILSEEIQESLKQILPLLVTDFHIKKDLKNVLGFKSLTKSEEILDLISTLKAKKKLSTDICKHLYKFLSDNTDAKQYSKLREKFKSKKLIYLRGNFFRPKDLVWKDKYDILKSRTKYIPLWKEYPELKIFFVDILKTPMFNNTLLYKHRLVEISEFETSKLDNYLKQCIYKIYKLINHELKDSKIPWLSEIPYLVKKNQKLEFSISENIFINDDREVYSLFKHKIKFLKLPEKSLPEYKEFIQHSDLNYLSEAIIKRLDNRPQKADILQELTIKAQSLKTYICSYLYHNSNDLFKTLVKKEKFSEFGKVRCYEVEDLRVKYVLNLKGKKPLEKISSSSAVYDIERSGIYIERGLGSQDQKTHYLLAKTINDFFHHHP